MDVDDSDDGWDAVANATSVSSPAVSSGSCVVERSFNEFEDEAHDLDLDQGWEELVQEFGPQTPPVVSNSHDDKSDHTMFGGTHTPGPSRKRGRPHGITGSHSYRKFLRESREAESAAAKMSKAEVCALARAAKIAKRNNIETGSQSSQSLSRKGSSELVSDSRAASSHSLAFFHDRGHGSDAFPAVGNALQSSVLAAALSCLKSGCEFDAGPAASSNPFQDFMVDLYGEESKKIEPEPERNPTGEEATLDLIFQPYRGYCSFQRDSDALKISRWQLIRCLIRSASVFKNCSSKLLGNFFAEVKQKISSTHRGLLFIAKFRFDETPSKISVEDLLSSSIPNPLAHHHKTARSSKQLCKLLQTEFSVSVVLQANDFKEPMMLSTSVPTLLQVLDRTTGNNIRQALEQSWNAIPELQSCMEGFDFKCLLFNTDEYGANDLAQWGMQLTRPGWLRLSTLCDIHKGSTCQGSVFSLAGPSISAVINLALSMTPAGSLGTMQSMLCDILTARFELRVGSPPYRPDADIFRTNLLDLYLSVPSSFALQVGTSISSRQRMKFSEKLKQRKIIEFFLNDDLRDHQRIIHWCKPGQYNSYDEALQIFLKYVVPALLPYNCPVFPRSRWFGADGALDWVGLLAGTHGLLAPLIASWTGRNLSVEPQVDPLEDMKDAIGLDDEGWQDFFGANRSNRQDANNALPLQDTQHHENEQDEHEHGQENQEQDSAQVVSAEQGDSQPQGEPAADAFDWHTYHQKLKTSVGEWVLGTRTGPQPETMLALMRYSTGPVLKLMVSLLYISSAKFLKDQYKAACETGRRQYRMLMAYEGAETKLLFANCLKMFQLPPPAIPQAEWRQDVLVLAFSMLSRMMCSAFQLLHWRRSKYPYKLFIALKNIEAAKDVFNDPKCLKDEVTQELCKRFPTQQEFCSCGCLSIIEALALQAETDIGPIERQHTIARRVIATRGANAKAVTLKALSADWLLRQCTQTKVNIQSYNIFDSATTRSKLRKQWKKKTFKAKPRKSKRGGGGPWRAFVSANLKGRKGDAETFRQLKQKYYALTEEEKRIYRQAGKLASESRRAGVKKPFGHSKSQQFMSAESCDVGLANAPAAGQMDAAIMPVPFLHVAVMDPLKDLKDQLQLVKQHVIQMNKEEVDVRQRFVESMKTFRGGSSSCGPPLQTDDLLQKGEGYLDSMPCVGNSIFPRPSTLPWAEWIPPADVYTQADLFWQIHFSIFSRR